jgi:hypothetical protein
MPHCCVEDLVVDHVRLEEFQTPALIPEFIILGPVILVSPSVHLDFPLSALSPYCGCSEGRAIGDVGKHFMPRIQNVIYWN